MDAGHKETDALIDDMQQVIARNYKQAVDEVQAKLDDYFRKFQSKDKEWQKQVAAGQKSATDYEKWRASQMLNGQRWVSMRDQLAADYHEANVAARGVVKDNLPEAYAINYNYGTYSVEKQAKVDTQFTLYDKDAAKKLLTDNPDLLPQMQPPLNEAKDIAWQKGQLQSVAFQSIVQGESIPNMAKRISQTLAVQNYASAVRYARTSITAAQNMARQDAFRRAADMGIKTSQKWMAVLDNRTRHEHRELDGQVRKLDEPFEVAGYELRFPGDPDCGDPSLVWNCRCRLDAAVDGWEDRVGKLRSSRAIGNMTYDQWKQAHPVYVSSTVTRTTTTKATTKATVTKTEPIKPVMTNKVVQGQNITATWVRRPDQFDFDIEDIINAQGYDGAPRILPRAEFNAAVKQANGGKGFIAQRTYSGPNQATVNAYRNELMHGKWYVDCSTGGAQYGRGMYCAADYTGKLSAGIQSEMKHYQALNVSRGNKYAVTETLTLDPSAKVVTYNELFSEFNGYKRNASQIFTEKYVEGMSGYSDDFMTMLRAELNISKQSYTELMPVYERVSSTEEYKKMGEVLEGIRAKAQQVEMDANNLNIGAYAAMQGYDAINAEGHGQSGSYTVILNRTKVIFLGGN